MARLNLLRAEADHENHRRRGISLKAALDAKVVAQRIQMLFFARDGSLSAPAFSGY
jgi:hypothetical protein